jgi:polysaccharide biosynthesis/export protein
MMRMTKWLSIAALVFMAVSCATPKVAYFMDAQLGQDVLVPSAVDLKLQEGDKISIIVNSRDPLLTNLFNLPIISNQIGGSSSTSISRGMAGYTIDRFGEIDFPVLGKLHVAGMSRSEIASYIKESLVSNNLLKDPVVTVEFENLTISVLGEVKNPGRISIDRDRVSLMDAISMAGDLTIYGKRDNVLVQREEKGTKTFYKVNLNSSADLYASPVYYLQQNDIVYVEPNDQRARQSTVNGNNVRSASFWISVVSAVTSITVMILNVVN